MLSEIAMMKKSKAKPAPEGFMRINILVDAGLADRLNEWRRYQPDIPTVSESVRRLVDLGIESQKKLGKKRDV